MKVILSRKGFDSKYGGIPSPILPDGGMISLPIPSKDNISYADIKATEKLSYFELIEQLSNKIRFNTGWNIISKDVGCHLDPDINHSVLERHADWKPIFGQINQSQTHLENQGVIEGDLFLFFGTFKKTALENGLYRFKGSQVLHVIFGYLQIGEIVRADDISKIPEWAGYHPHAMNKRLGGNNTLYFARENLSFLPDTPGAGTFTYDNKRVLTKTGCSKSKWNSPLFFKDVNISYHSKSSWKKDYFQSASIGQEFVIADNVDAQNWAEDVIKQ